MPTPATTTPRARTKAEKPSLLEAARLLVSEIERRRGEFLYNARRSQSLIAVSGRRLWMLALELGLKWSPPLLHVFIAEAERRGWRLVGRLERRSASTIWLFELPPQPPNQAQRAVAGDAQQA